MSLALKKRVQKEVRQAGRAGLVEPQAFGVLVDYIKEIGEDQCEDAVHRVLKIAVQGTWGVFPARCTPTRGRAPSPPLDRRARHGAPPPRGLAFADGKPAEMITAHQMQEAVSRLKGQEMPMDMVSVINVFDVPKILYDPIQRKFHLDTEPRSQLADAEVLIRSAAGGRQP